MNLIPSQKGLHWDSTLERIDDQRFRLILQFRIYLARTEPGDPFQVGPYSLVNGQVHDADMNQNFTLLYWLDGSWPLYCASYRSLIERSWSGQFRLVPDKPWYVAQPGGNRIAATIDCELSVQVLDSVALRPHFTYYCLFLMPSSLRPSSAYKTQLGVLTHKSVMMGNSEATLPVYGQQHRIRFYQEPAGHEFGHVLGLHHVGGANDDQSYGTTLDQRRNIMGAGMDMSAAEARPWLSTLQQHLLPQDTYDRSIQFTGLMKGLPFITYWDYGVVAPKATAPVTWGSPAGAPGSVGSPAADPVTRGPAGVIWKHLITAPTAD